MRTALVAVVSVIAFIIIVAVGMGVSEVYFHDVARPCILAFWISAGFCVTSPVLAYVLMRTVASKESGMAGQDKVSGEEAELRCSSGDETINIGGKGEDASLCDDEGVR